MNVSTMLAQRNDSVKRGYRLHLTNLESQPFTYLLRFWVTPPDAQPHWAAPFNEFFQFYSGLFGIPLTSVGSPFVRSGNVYMSSQTFQVLPQQTVTIGFSPATFADLSQDIQFLEGYVTLELPVLRTGQGNLRFRPAPQAAGAVKVLLNPEMTMVHTDTQGAGYTQNLDGVVTGKVSRTLLNFDTVEPLVPASGKAENAVVPNGSVLLTHDALVNALQMSAVAESYSVLSSQMTSPAERMGALVELLCELDTKKEFVNELNKLLEKNQAAARICKGSV
jgi:hypothetical protein